MKTLRSRRKVSPSMGYVYVNVALRAEGREDTYQGKFLVDTGAIDSMAPADELHKIGVRPVGKKVYELANGERLEFEFGLVEISFMGELTAGRVIFGPLGCE